MAYISVTELLLEEARSPTAFRDPRQKRILQQFACCRTEQLGGRLLRCGSCRTQVVLYNRCNHRGCPQCARSIQLQWLHRTQRRLLPVGHHHLVFAGPSALTQLWQRYRKAVTAALFAAAQRTVRFVSRQSGLCFGALMTFHSHAVGMSYKAHVHCMLSEGGVDGDGRWHRYRDLTADGLTERFQRYALVELSKRLPREQLALVDATPAEGWQLYVTYHRQPRQTLVSYFARTLHGVVINPTDELQVHGETVSFRCYHDGKQRVTTLSCEEFVSRYCAHIPPKATVTVRRYGLYATRSAPMLTQLLEQFGEPQPPQSGVQNVEFTAVCPICHGTLHVEIVFAPHEPPMIVRLIEHNRGSPVRNGEITRCERIPA